jgi:PAS domain S-box-containing protein
MCGFGSPEEMIREVTDIAQQLYVNPEDRQRIKRLYEDPGVVKGFEAQFRRKDGGVIWVSITARSVRDEGGNLLHYEGIIEDITERKQAEKALRESEEKYRTLVEALPHAVAIIQDARVVFANRAAAEMFRVGTPEQLIDTDAVMCSVEREGKCLAAKDRERLTGAAATPGHYETTLQRTDGDSFPADVFVRPIVFSGRRAIQVAVIDITERKRAEIELQRYQEQLRFLASELSLTEARERRRLATDLHDSIGQTLAMSKLKVDALRSEASSAVAANELRDVCNLLDRAIQDTRSLAFELSPPVLYELGIEAALESLVEQMQQVHGIPIKLLDDGRPKSLSEDTAVFCFRAVQELLINAVKHARPRKIEVSIRTEGSQIRITVVDDGTGFVPGEVFSREGRKRGFGLFSIRERLQLLGGSMKIDSKPRQGARVTLLAPVGA